VFCARIDLYQTTGGGSPWVDRERIPVPQADEQQRFFARLVRHLVGFKMPLPQLWYFPEKAKTMSFLHPEILMGKRTSLYTDLAKQCGELRWNHQFLYFSQSEIPGSPGDPDDIFGNDLRSRWA
jgi:hypothetical protein